MWQTLPEFGTGVLYAILVTAALTLAVAVVAGRTGRPRFLESARLGAYGTVGLVALAVMLLAYAFVTHDFRIRYVAHTSDRSMPTVYLLTALWGGQDGSLLWWLFLMSLYTGACVAWMKGKYRELQPYVIATLMSVTIFFGVLMLFAANPFWTATAGARSDGQGMNPLLEDIYMIIHPPSLYMGFVGCAVPFAFAMAALITGRLDNEWIAASRKWMLFAWMFLSVGNGLGMIWAYKELGWGGYWAWDPVENGACLPWFTASAYLHSVMTQERRGMLKVWNVSLICLTFFLTIFGTFLTRSGLIVSVHSFAQSSIGTYFVYFMGVIVGACSGLIVWRLPRLRSEGQIESLASREAAFVLNNWALLGIAVFIAVATVFPKVSELWGEQITVGPPFFDRWIVPFGLVIFFLMGAGTLFGWRKTSDKALWRAFTVPLAAVGVAVVAHFAVGPAMGFPPIVAAGRLYPGALGEVLRALGAVLPALSIALCAFNLAVIAQEYVRGVGARRRAHPDEGPLTALARLVAKARRRYGGYIVHAGIVFMFLGFTGKSWNVDKEASLRPGESFEVGPYKLTYTGSRMEVDAAKRMVFADLAVERGGRPMGTASPAKFIYRRMPEAPTTEVALLHSLRDDLYVVVGMVNPETKSATFQIHVNPLVTWIWAGLLILIAGSIVAMWPEITLQEAGAWRFARAMGTVTFSALLGLGLAMTPARAYAQEGASSLHAGAVEMRTQAERDLFPQLRCTCGSCGRLPLSNCACPYADQNRTEVRRYIEAGLSTDQILEQYAATYGATHIAIPPNKGKLKAIWAVPLAVIGAGAAGAGFVLRSWKKNAALAAAGGPKAASASAERDDYDRRLDEELKRLDDE
jgi:cytochrome c-type biogenesis protein CcmF